MALIERFEQVTKEWLSQVLGMEIADLKVVTSESTWGRHASIVATDEKGEVRRLWLKICLGETFGRSEVDYYTNDYLDLPDSPLLSCFDACFVEGVGYHILLEDLSEGWGDRKESAPSLEHGLAIAEGLAVLHAHHWESAAPPSQESVEREIEEARRGVAGLEGATGRAFAEKFESHAARLTERFKDPKGMTLLHGDLNPTNVLSPRGADSPVYFLDRQPFDWSITYGLAVYDLAYALVPWWPRDFRTAHQEEILHRWWTRLNRPDYTWSEVQSDWDLSVERCLHVPLGWCQDPESTEKMRWLWHWQLTNMLGDLAGEG